MLLVGSEAAYIVHEEDAEEMVFSEVLMDDDDLLLW